MAFGLFRKQVPEPVAPTVAPQVPAAVATPEVSTEADSAKEILELLELELGAMIRQLERAASSVADGAEATAAKLATIRARTDALTGRSSDAQSTATTFSEAADRFTHSAEGIGQQVRSASQLADDAAAAAREAMQNAARHAGDAQVFAEAGEDDRGRTVAEVFVRDRGPGFDLPTVPADRLGVRESILGRMERAGGTARIRSGPGGTEVHLTLTEPEGARARTGQEHP